MRIKIYRGVISGAIVKTFDGSWDFRAKLGEVSNLYHGDSARMAYYIASHEIRRAARDKMQYDETIIERE